MISTMAASLAPVFVPPAYFRRHNDDPERWGNLGVLYRVRALRVNVNQHHVKGSPCPAKALPEVGRTPTWLARFAPAQRIGAVEIKGALSGPFLLCEMLRISHGAERRRAFAVIGGASLRWSVSVHRGQAAAPAACYFAK
jgi:hypothetical protein